MVRDWAPATIPPLPANSKGNKDDFETDTGYNKPFKIDFMTYETKDGAESSGNEISRKVELRFNFSRKGTPHSVFEQYQMLVAKWKHAQKQLEAMGYTTTKASVMSTREPPLFGPNDYVLPDSVTPAPRKLYTVKPVGDIPIPCGEKRCRLPDCYCNASNIPGNLNKKQTPQIVMVTFDDSVNGGNADLLNKLFASNRLNPNGCPVTGTFFLANQWTDYKIVREMSQKGHEIASHSLS